MTERIECQCATQAYKQNRQWNDNANQTQLGNIEVWKLVEQDPGELSEEQMLKTKKKQPYKKTEKKKQTWYGQKQQTRVDAQNIQVDLC